MYGILGIMSYGQLSVMITMMGLSFLPKVLTLNHHTWLYEDMLCSLRLEWKYNEVKESVSSKLNITTQKSGKEHEGASQAVKPTDLASIILKKKVYMCEIKTLSLEFDPVNEMF